jgi:hypothetical protein
MLDCGGGDLALDLGQPALLAPQEEQLHAVADG